MPKGIVNITSKNTNDQTEPIENIPQKSVLTKAPTINPKNAPIKNIETLINLVNP